MAIDYNLTIAYMIETGALPEGITINPIKPTTTYETLVIEGAVKPPEQDFIDAWAIIEPDVVAEELSTQSFKDLAADTNFDTIWQTAKDFLDDLEGDITTFFGGGGTLATLPRPQPAVDLYDSWRIKFDALPQSNPVKRRMVWVGYMTNETYIFVPEPSPVNPDYKVWFNESLFTALQYIVIRAILKSL